MIKAVLKDAESHMKKAIEHLKHDLQTIRTGRATPALVEELLVDYYGTPTPLQQLSTITAPEPRLLTIRPWDVSSLHAIEKALLKSDLGLTPTNDGKIVRLTIPPLTEERRRELVKVVAKRVEEGRVAIRNVRRDSLKDVQDLKDEKMISEDDFYRGKDELQKLTDKYIAQADELGQAKEAEVLEV